MNKYLLLIFSTVTVATIKAPHYYENGLRRDGPSASSRNDQIARARAIEEQRRRDQAAQGHPDGGNQSINSLRGSQESGQRRVSTDQSTQVLKKPTTNNDQEADALRETMEDGAVSSLGRDPLSVVQEDPQSRVSIEDVIRKGLNLNDFKKRAEFFVEIYRKAHFNRELKELSNGIDAVKYRGQKTSNFLEHVAEDATLLNRIADGQDINKIKITQEKEGLKIVGPRGEMILRDFVTLAFVEPEIFEKMVDYLVKEKKKEKIATVVSGMSVEPYKDVLYGKYDAMNSLGSEVQKKGTTPTTEERSSVRYSQAAPSAQEIAAAPRAIRYDQQTVVNKMSQLEKQKNSSEVIRIANRIKQTRNPQDRKLFTNLNDAKRYIMIDDNMNFLIKKLNDGSIKFNA